MACTIALTAVLTAACTWGLLVTAALLVAEAVVLDEEPPACAVAWVMALTTWVEACRGRWSVCLRAGWCKAAGAAGVLSSWK